VAGGAAARHHPIHPPFSPRDAEREGGRGMSGAKPRRVNSLVSELAFCIEMR
jgi:hypothetical protein